MGIRWYQHGYRDLGVNGVQASARATEGVGFLMPVGELGVSRCNCSHRPRNLSLLGPLSAKPGRHAHETGSTHAVPLTAIVNNAVVTVLADTGMTGFPVTFFWFDTRRVRCEQTCFWVRRGCQAGH